MLSQQKKQLKIEMAQFNKNGNDKIEELSSHKLFIDKLLIKYKASIKNKFNISQIPFTTNPNTNDGKICTHCGHLAINAQAMNLHLLNHQNNNKQILSSQDWKYHLIKIIRCYSIYIKDFEDKITNQMLTLQEPILPPLTPLNVHQVYGISQNQYQTNARIHNKNVLKEYHDNTNNPYPKTMDLKTVLKLERGTNIDYRDFNARFLKAQIMQIEIDKDKLYKKYGITYEGWDDKWNVWSIPKHQFQRYAKYGSISTRKLHRQCMNYINLKSPNGEYLEVKPLHLFYHNMYKRDHAQDPLNPINGNYCNQYLQWHIGQVSLTDAESAQVQVILYKLKNNKWTQPIDKNDVEIYWVHLDNDKECAPLNTNIKNPQIV